MQRKTFVTVVAITVCVLAAAGAILFFVTGRQNAQRSMRISEGRVNQDVPMLIITNAEFTAMRAVRTEETVANTLLTVNRDKSVGMQYLPPELATELFGNILPTGAQIGDFAVLGENVVFDYILNNSRIILESLANDSVRKTVAQYENIRDITEGRAIVYDNTDNRRFSVYE